MNVYSYFYEIHDFNGQVQELKNFKFYYQKKMMVIRDLDFDIKLGSKLRRFTESGYEEYYLIIAIRKIRELSNDTYINLMAV